MAGRYSQDLNISTSKNPTMDLHFLLLGKTGVGKSETGNTLLQQDIFKTSSDSTSDTSSPDFGTGRFEDCDLLVVDTPGLCDTRKGAREDIQSAAEHMYRALDLCYGGIDAFLFTIKYGDRFTQETRDTIESLKNIFGALYIEHLIVIVTHGDNFRSDRLKKKDEMTFQAWCQKQQGDMAQLYQECGRRFVLFNNNADETEKHIQIKTVVNHARDLQIYKGRYTVEYFRDAYPERNHHLLVKMEPVLRKEIEKKIWSIVDKIETLEGQTFSEAEQTKTALESLRNDIELYDVDNRVLGDLKMKIDDIQKCLNKSKKVQNLKKDLNEIKENRDQWVKIGGTVTFATAFIAAPLAALTMGGTAVAFKMLEKKEEEKKEELTQVQSKQTQQWNSIRRGRRLK